MANTDSSTAEDLDILKEALQKIRKRTNSSPNGDTFWNGVVVGSVSDPRKLRGRFQSLSRDLKNSKLTQEEQIELQEELKRWNGKKAFNISSSEVNAAKIGNPRHESTRHEFTHQDSKRHESKRPESNSDSVVQKTALSIGGSDEENKEAGIDDKEENEACGDDTVFDADEKDAHNKTVDMLQMAKQQSKQEKNSMLSKIFDCAPKSSLLRAPLFRRILDMTRAENPSAAASALNPNIVIDGLLHLMNFEERYRLQEGDLACNELTTRKLAGKLSEKTTILECKESEIAQLTQKLSDMEAVRVTSLTDLLKEKEAMLTAKDLEIEALKNTIEKLEEDKDSVNSQLSRARDEHVEQAGIIFDLRSKIHAFESKQEKQN